jgi:hypothetical protein
LKSFNIGTSLAVCYGHFSGGNEVDIKHAMKRLEKSKPSLAGAIDSCNTFAQDIAGIDELAFETWEK